MRCYKRKEAAHLGRVERKQVHIAQPACRAQKTGGLRVISAQLIMCSELQRRTEANEIVPEESNDNQQARYRAPTHSAPCIPPRSVRKDEGKAQSAERKDHGGPRSCSQAKRQAAQCCQEIAVFGSGRREQQGKTAEEIKLPCSYGDFVKLGPPHYERKYAAEAQSAAQQIVEPRRRPWIEKLNDKL